MYSPRIPKTSPACSCPDGFTLVETALAVAVVAFAFVALLALIPAGLTTFRRSIDQTVCAQIAQQVLGDAEETDFDTLIDQVDLEALSPSVGYTFRAPTIATHTLRYFDDQGTEVIPANPSQLSSSEKSRIIYYVNTRVMPRPPLPQTGGPSSSTAGVVHPESVAQITIQVAHNPGQLDIPFSKAAPDDLTSSDRNLFVAPPGIDVLTFCSHIGRNL